MLWPLSMIRYQLMITKQRTLRESPANLQGINWVNKHV